MKTNSMWLIFQIPFFPGKLKNEERIEFLLNFSFFCEKMENENRQKFIFHFSKK